MNPNLFKIAVDFAKEYNAPKNNTYAAALTKSGKILTSVYIDATVDSAQLCAETGCIAEAIKLKDPITHSLCIWYGPTTDVKLLSACGICQERLSQFGMDVMIAVSENKGEVVYKPLKELRPHFWLDAFNEESNTGQKN